MCPSRWPAAVIKLGSQYCLRNNQRSVLLGHVADRYCIRYCKVQYIVLHPVFSTNAFLIKLFKNFEEQVEDVFNVISDSLVKILSHTA